MVLDRIKKGLRPESPVIAQLREKKWTGDAQKKDLLAKLRALPQVDADEIAWAAAEADPEVRAAGVEVLRKCEPRAGFEALVPFLRTRSEAQRRAVQRTMKEVGGRMLGPLLSELTEKGDDFGRLAALELARELPGEQAFGLFKKILSDPHPKLRARALRALSETDAPGSSALAANLALPLLQDEDEEIRLAALATLERNPSEALISHVLDLARSGGGRIVEASFSALRRLLPTAQTDHTAEILPLLSDGQDAVRAGGVSLLSQIPADLLARRFVEHYRTAFVWVRDRALTTAMQGIPNFVPALLALGADPDPALRKDSMELALNVSDARAVPTWMALLADRDWWVRQRAIECLGRQGKGNEQVFGRLVTELKDPETALAACAALGEFGDPRAAGPLFEFFKASFERPEDQMEILDALARLGEKDQRVAPVLANVSTLEALSVRVREKARRLYGKLVGDAARDQLPRITAVAKTVDLAATPEPTLVDFLADTVARGASDFHLGTGFVPHQRLHGALLPLDVPAMPAARAEKLLQEVLSPAEWQKLLAERQLDVCIKIDGLGRFRSNVFSQRSGLDASFRVIPDSIPVLDELGLPATASQICYHTQGLVLVTGPAGCGKSTTLAALVNRVNETRAGHIITIEDPIEFVHPNKESLVNQRQVPNHTASFARALKAALREDPDVILVGELRDLETIQLAITASETGHLVFGTLNTTTATATVDRVINAFPAGQQSQIRAMIADSLKAVISQTLLPRRSGHGRVAAFEILRATPAVSALIREAKTFQLPSLLQTGTQAGMNTLDQALLKLAEEGKVDLEAAMDRAQRKEPFEKMLNEEKAAFA